MKLHARVAEGLVEEAARGEAGDDGGCAGFLGAAVEQLLGSFLVGEEGGGG